MPTDSHRRTPKQATQPPTTSPREFRFYLTASVSVSIPATVWKQESARARTQAEGEEKGRRGRASLTWYGLAAGVGVPVDAPAMPAPPPGKAAVISPPRLAISSLWVSLSGVPQLCSALVVSSHLLLPPLLFAFAAVVAFRLLRLLCFVSVPQIARIWLGPGGKRRKWGSWVSVRPPPGRGVVSSSLRGVGAASSSQSQAGR